MRRTVVNRDPRTREEVGVMTAPRKAVEVGTVLTAARAVEAEQRAREGQGRLPPGNRPPTALKPQDPTPGASYEPLYVMRFESILQDKQIDRIRKRWAEAFAPDQAPRLIILDAGARLELVNAPIVGMKP